MAFVKCTGEGCQLCALFSPPTVHEVAEEKVMSREGQIKFAQDTYTCPECGEPVKTEGYHERDSTYDRTDCTKCDFGFYEMETWSWRK